MLHALSYIKSHYVLRICRHFRCRAHRLKRPLMRLFWHWCLYYLRLLKQPFPSIRLTRRKRLCIVHCALCIIKHRIWVNNSSPTECRILWQSQVTLIYIMNKPTRIRELCLPVAETTLCVCYHTTLFCSSYCHIKQSSFFFKVSFRLYHHARKQILLHSHNVYVRKFQSLRCMHGHQRNTIPIFLFLCILVCYERHFVQEIHQSYIIISIIHLLVAKLMHCIQKLLYILLACKIFNRRIYRHICHNSRRKHHSLCHMICILLLIFIKE